MALQELLRLQQRRAPTPMQLDTRFQLPKFVGQMNGENVDSWLHSLSTYFCTCPEMTKDMKLQIVGLQLEGIAQTWWDTQLETYSWVMDRGDPVETQTPHITTWDGFFQALRERFYPSGYRQNLLARWLQLRQLANQSVQGYIDIFYKLCIQLHITDPEEVLIVKFNYGLLLSICHEVDLFESSSLDKAFLWALDVEHKVAPQIHSPQPRYDPSTAGPSQVTPTTTSTPRTMPWCTFHKTNSHASVDCRALQNLHPNKTLFAEVAQSDSPDPPEVVSLKNPTEVDPSLILMTTNEHDTSHVPLFTHNCQIKHELATLILDNGSQKNLIAQDLVQCLQLPTTSHPEPYQLGWVQKEGCASLSPGVVR
jgi:hypothetical protein